MALGRCILFIASAKIPECEGSILPASFYWQLITSVSSIYLPNGHYITSIPRYPNFDEFHVISTYFFNVILLIEKSTSFTRTFFDEISMAEKCTLFPRTFLDSLSMVEKSTLFPRTFLCNFDGRKIHVVSTYCFWCNFNDRKIHVVSAYFFWWNFDGWNIHDVSTYFFRLYPRCFYLHSFFF